MIPRLVPFVAAALLAAAPLAAQSAFPPDSALRALLSARVGDGGTKAVVIGMSMVPSSTVPSDVSPLANRPANPKKRSPLEVAPLP